MYLFVYLLMLFSQYDTSSFLMSKDLKQKLIFMFLLHFQVLENGQVTVHCNCCSYF